jgi:hypothetical protein
MKLAIALIVFFTMSAQAQVWKVLPKGVRVIGYRNVTTGKISSNFNQSGQESDLGSSFKIDASTINKMTNNVIIPGVDIDESAYKNLVVGEYKIDADAQFNVHGTGFGYGLTDRVMLYAEVAYYNAQVRARIQRTAGNTYSKVAEMLENSGRPQDRIIAENLRNMIDANEGTIQSVVTNYYGYKPLGDWYGSGYGDMETGFMIKAVDKGIWGLMLYPGVVLPTGREDDPDILQDVGFGDGQYDLFGELSTGYIINDRLNIGTTMRYTYQAPASKTLRVPNEQNFQLSDQKGNFNIKYGDKFNWTLRSTYSLNDWISFTPVYRFIYQANADYDSQFTNANKYLSYNSHRLEHQAQLTTSLSSITPFLKKQFILPAQINMNLVKTISGENVPNQERFEIEFRMLF